MTNDMEKFVGLVCIVLGCVIGVLGYPTPIYAVIGGCSIGIGFGFCYVIKG